MTPVTASSIPEWYTDGITTVGSVKRVFFHVLIDSDGARNWYYFGTDPADKPPTTADPVVEVAYVQFPVAFDDLGNDAEPTMFELALRAAMSREGIGGGLAEVWTDLYEEAGVARNFEFRFKLRDGTWYYYGSTQAQYPAPQGATVHERERIQFPSAFDDVNAEDEGEWLYDLALRAGLAREGLQQ